MIRFKPRKGSAVGRLALIVLISLVALSLLVSGCGINTAQKPEDQAAPNPVSDSTQPIPAAPTENQQPSASDPNANPPSSNQQPDLSAKPIQTKTTLTLYFGDQQAEYLVPEFREITKGSETLEAAIITELIKGPQKSELSRTIPKEAKLLSVNVINGVAYVNFSKELQTKHWGGSAGETMTVYSIVNSLGVLPGIQKVQFLIEGDKQESIFGHMDTSSPIAPNWDLSAKTDSGRYVGQIDSNSIEVKISGAPDAIAAKAFRLSDGVKAKFDSYGLKSGDVIRFTYQTNEHGQGIITEITKI